MQKKPILKLSSAIMVMALVASCSGEGSSRASPAYSNTAGSMALHATAVSSDCARISTGPNGDLNGFVPFPKDNLWNQNISSAPVRANSESLIANYANRIGSNVAMHADFSSVYGEVYNVVDASEQPLQNISIDQYPGESDIMPVPISNQSIVKGGSQNCTDGGDCHLFVLDRNQCWLYETWLTSFDGTQWHASNMAVWDMLSSTARPYGWTAADAAGLSIFSGLVRYDEVAKGAIEHAIRFTLSHTGNSFVAPATHSAGYDASAFSMGTRFRLKANFDTSSFSQVDQIILTAMKNYGMILADNGSDLEIAGANDPRWDTNDIVAMKGVHLSDFEVLDSGPAMTRANPPSGPAPQINDFSASLTQVHAGERVTLNIDTSPEAWNFIDVLGPVRGTSVTVIPTATTIYTLNSTNAYGRTTRSLTVEVQ